MKITYNWIKDYADIKGTCEELAEKLTMSGSEVGQTEKNGDDVVMDLEITSNRPDCLSIMGLAREASAVFQTDLKTPDMDTTRQLAVRSDKEIKCLIKDSGLCPHYTATVIKDVSVARSKGIVSERLTAIGTRKVNNVVDVTNFCLLETGQPMHAFDLDKIRGEAVEVRKAKKGEKIVTIDGVERELAETMLVIADEQGPIAIAGVMGGKGTEVTESTRNLLLESAYFDPLSVRRTSRTLGLSSDSSYRFERGVDKELVFPASARAAGLILEQAGGSITSFTEAGTSAFKRKEVTLRTKQVERMLGIDISAKKINGILDKLGLVIKSGTDDMLVLEVPGFREDLTREIDIIEEVARIFGYSEIPSRIEKFMPESERKEKQRKVREKVCAILSGMGLREVITYSLISESAANIFMDIEESAVSRLRNPLSEEHKVLTPQLMSGMMRALSWNYNRKNTDLGLFELGKTYRGNKQEVVEDWALCVAMTGNLRKDWKRGEEPVIFYDIKGFLTALLGRFNIECTFVPTAVKGFVLSAAMVFKGEKEPAGYLGSVDKQICKEYDIDQDIFIAQISLGRLTDMAKMELKYVPVPRFPFSRRDVSVLSDASISADKIDRIIRDNGEGILREVELIDTYEGESIPKGKRSLTYRIDYGLDDRTLTEEEIEKAHNSVKTALQKHLGVSFR